MSKIAIVFWSMTGNTEKMAHRIADGVKEAGGEAVLMGPDGFSPASWEEYSAAAFGCPAMGAEVLEESEFEPMFAALEPTLAGKKIALFGSYGWGDGQWMRDWCARCAAADLLDPDGMTANYEPDELCLTACFELGKELASC